MAAPTPDPALEPAATPRAAAVIVAAGASTRIGGALRKPFIELGGTSVIEYACAAFSAASSIAEIVLVARAEDVELLERWSAERPAFVKVRAVVPGGATRAESVRRGVRWCHFGLPLVAVHDAARPFVSGEAIDACVATAAREGVALLAIPARDTLKRSSDGAHAESTLERDGVWAAQTPQVFEQRRLRATLLQAARDGCESTDEAGVWERYVGPVALVQGSSLFFKLTSPEDVELAQALCARRAGRPDPLVPPPGRSHDA
jgi:2-C-methyl-D-erythritol 4-phosphate cytidylyltransferase